MTFRPNYEYITKYDATGYTKGRGKYGTTPKEIVIHHWGNDGQSFIGVINWFCRPNANESAHYVVEAGKVACLVDCKDTAWHAGNWDENCKSVGIECRTECTNEDIDTLAQLVASLWQAYPNMSRKLRYHKEFYNTVCPGRWINKLQIIENKANQYLNQQPANEVWHIVKPGESLSGICAKYGVKDWQKVAQMNRLRDPNFIVPNQRLRIK